MKKKVLILEMAENPLAISKDGDLYRFTGPCADFGKPNENGRKYKKEDYLKNFDYLLPKIEEKSLLGELDHNDSYSISMKSVSHLITGLKYDDGSQEVVISIELLPTVEGKKVMVIADRGIPIFISSRASGYIDDEGNVELECIYTYDIVSEPGFKNARLNRLNESLGIKSKNIAIYEWVDKNTANPPQTTPVMLPIVAKDNEKMFEAIRREFNSSLNLVKTSVNEMRKELIKLSFAKQQPVSLNEGKSLSRPINEGIWAWDKEAAKEAAKELSTMTDVSDETMIGFEKKYFNILGDDVLWDILAQIRLTSGKTDIKKARFDALTRIDLVNSAMPEDKYPEDEDDLNEGKRKRVRIYESAIRYAKMYKVNLTQNDIDELGPKVDREKFKEYFNIPVDADQDPDYKRDSNYNVSNLKDLKELEKTNEETNDGLSMDVISTPEQESAKIVAVAVMRQLKRESKPANFGNIADVLDECGYGEGLSPYEAELAYNKIADIILKDQSNADSQISNEKLWEYINKVSESLNVLINKTNKPCRSLQKALEHINKIKLIKEDSEVSDFDVAQIENAICGVFGDTNKTIGINDLFDITSKIVGLDLSEGMWDNAINKLEDGGWSIDKTPINESIENAIGHLESQKLVNYLDNPDEHDYHVDGDSIVFTSPNLARTVATSLKQNGIKCELNGSTIKVDDDLSEKINVIEKRITRLESKKGGRRIVEGIQDSYNIYPDDGDDNDELKKACSYLNKIIEASKSMPSGWMDTCLDNVSKTHDAEAVEFVKSKIEGSSMTTPMDIYADALNAKLTDTIDVIEDLYTQLNIKYSLFDDKKTDDLNEDEGGEMNERKHGKTKLKESAFNNFIENADLDQETDEIADDIIADYIENYCGENCDDELNLSRKDVENMVDNFVTDGGYDEDEQAKIVDNIMDMLANKEATKLLIAQVNGGVYESLFNSHRVNTKKPHRNPSKMHESKIPKGSMIRIVEGKFKNRSAMVSGYVFGDDGKIEGLNLSIGNRKTIVPLSYTNVSEKKIINPKKRRINERNSIESSAIDKSNLPSDVSKLIDKSNEIVSSGNDSISGKIDGKHAWRANGEWSGYGDDGEFVIDQFHGNVDGRNISWEYGKIDESATISKSKVDKSNLPSKISTIVSAATEIEKDGHTDIAGYKDGRPIWSASGKWSGSVGGGDSSGYNQYDEDDSRKFTIDYLRSDYGDEIVTWNEGTEPEVKKLNENKQHNNVPTINKYSTEVIKKKVDERLQHLNEQKGEIANSELIVNYPFLVLVNEDTKSLFKRLPTARQHKIKSRVSESKNKSAENISKTIYEYAVKNDVILDFETQLSDSNLKIWEQADENVKRKVISVYNTREFRDKLEVESFFESFDLRNDNEKIIAPNNNFLEKPINEGREHDYGTLGYSDNDIDRMIGPVFN